MDLRLTLSISCAFVFGLSACAPRDAGFTALQAQLAERAALEARWNRMSADAVPEGVVASLLEGGVDADSAVRVAMVNNAGLQALFEELGIARARLLGASLPPNVTVDAEFATVSGAGRRDYGFAATVDLSRLMFTSLRRNVATADLTATRIRTTGDVLAFAHTVRNAYYDYQAAEQLHELDLTVLEAAAASYDAALRLSEAGNISALELANEQAFYEEARSQAALAEAAALGRREALNILMGLAGSDANWVLAGRLGEPVEPLPGLGMLEDDAIAESLDLLELESRYSSAASRANLARAEGLVPSLGAGVGVGREEGRQETGPVFSLELPLFDRGQGEIELARAEMRQIEELYRDRSVRVRAFVRSAHNDLVIATRRVEHYRDVLLPLRERIVQETQLQYNAMQVGVFQLIVARREQIRTGQEYVLALREYWRSRSALDQILAGRLVEAGGLFEVPTVAW